MPSGPAATLCIGVSICAEACGSSLTPKSGQDINLGLLRTISSFSDTDDALDALPLRDCLLPAPLAAAEAAVGGVVEMKMLFSSPSPCV